MSAIVDLGFKAGFARRDALIVLDLSSVSDFLWRNGGPPSLLLSEKGVQPTDRIICEEDGQLWDCGQLSDLGWAENMVAARTWDCDWWRLPCA